MSKKPDIRKCRELIRDCERRDPTDLRYRIAGYVLAEHPIRVSEIPAHLRQLWEHGMSAGISLGHHASHHRPKNHDDDAILKNAMRRQLEAFAQNAGRAFKQDMRVLDDAVHEILDKKNYPLPLSKSIADARSAAGAGFRPSSVKHLAYVKFKNDPASFVFAAADEIFDHV